MQNQLLNKIYLKSLELMPHNIRYALYHNTRLFNKTNRSKGSDLIEHNSIFIHIPRTAGTSLRKTFYKYRFGAHKTIFKHSLLFTKKEFEHLWKFTIVRNPLDRLLSAYRFLKRGGMHDNDARWARDNLSKFNSFDEFVKKWLTKTNVYSYIHFKPQYTFVCINSKIAVDDVFRFENLKHDYDLICDRLGVRRDLPVLNKTSPTTFTNNSYKDFYSEESFDIAKYIYKKDIDIFKYII